MFGGINNPALFNVNDRMARDKLRVMAGIMASSTELLNSQLNENEPAISPYRERKNREESFNQDVYLGMRNRMDEQAGIRRNAEGFPLNPNNERMTETEYFRALGPLLDKRDENQYNIRNYGDDAMRGRSFGFPAQNYSTGGNIKLPEVRMASLSPVQPARKPMGVAKPPVPQGPSTPPNQRPTPKMLSNGGPTTPTLMDMFKKGVGSGNITQTPSPMAVPQAFAGLYELIKNMMPGSEEQAKEDINKISKATDGTTEEKTKAITNITGQPPTEEGVKESYKIVTGNKAPERLSIDELDDRIMKVLISGSLAQPGSLGARVAQAYALGLAGKRETAMLRAGVGKTGSSGKTVEPFQNAVVRVFNDIMGAPGQYKPKPEEAMTKAIEQVSRLYGLDPSTVAPGSIPIPGTTTTPTTNMTSHRQANDAAKKAGKNFYTIDGNTFKVQ